MDAPACCTKLAGDPELVIDSVVWRESVEGNLAAQMLPKKVRRAFSLFYSR
jgi:hypothetical protein